MGELSRHKAMFHKLLEGQETLGEDEVRVLRHAARHPDLAGNVSRSLEAAANLHEAARLSDEGSVANGETFDRGVRSGRRPLTPGEIRRDIERVIGSPYPPRGSSRSRQ